MQSNTLSVDTEYPKSRESLPEFPEQGGRFRLRFASNASDLDQVLRLRYEVFNLELNEGLDDAHRTGRDEDPFDAGCHHLMIVDAGSDLVVGTYRMQTYEMARNHLGFYSDAEYDLSHFPEEILLSSVELGRACIHKDYRSGRALMLLWRGLAGYAAHNHKRYLFGCCSLTSQDPLDGLRMQRYLQAHGHTHAGVSVPTRAGFQCDWPADRSAAATDTVTVNVPTLMKLYLAHGARICSTPAIDRVFRTIDFLGLFDLEALTDRQRAMFLD
ncbi:MAG: GNAT family N-acetyltransferase [Verrucomicrobia bacterium]|nr:GNAT family N-acetyltransferase [Verrucomicrobiota bacterium]MDA1088010.1 GNAT family N-acetyltransferase [Verrucomicrobiota bacterium]